MMALWMMIVMLTAGIVAVLLVPMAFRRQAGAAPREDYDLNVYKDQLSEVDKDLERGLVSDAEAVAARTEIKRRMLAIIPSNQTDAAQEGGRGVMIGIGAFVSVSAIAGYLWLGSPNQPDVPFASRNVPQQTASSAPGPTQDGGLGSVVTSLAERLKTNPNDMQGWILLGRSYMSMERPNDAAEAFKRAIDLGGNRPDVMADYAEALAIAADNAVPAEARLTFFQVLSDDPYNVKARFYLGLDQAQQGNFRDAMQQWTDLIAVSPPGAPWIEQVRSQIAKAGRSGKVDPGTIKPSKAALAFAKVRPAPPPQPKMPPATAAAPSSTPGPTQEDMKAAQEMSSEDRQAMIRSMVQRLADRLEENPNDKQGWMRLARAYEVLGEKEKAKKARERAAAVK
ncbi:MAG: c-type cytochrome biogenesis protein CcmI [Rhodospirillaceae bacterium]|jgi:cytochrome c-type biogenesis protein CcmH|nr:c-type cytochrome biogenesis protein CcmI [Rhodospirillaceae bacterium]MBT4700461.1 c-type cytochrome biogenesis protein CcmI [Rhodospirillaceae bacterium]MBT5036535.1 c-type cytochrome biogenesis protein CcmI [Rhodospirillaceae bacterium]MBT6220026.1 c-type cytochrome biogenesis protein CcmI [Rhodospirillaceae bacterium]MBT6362565.1 c-type cytochrome biogenesis protein CcmI [Rhodospirillaceae bacterium]